MERARRHQRPLAAVAFGLIALVAELVGRSLTHRLDVGRHVAPPSYSGAEYYPFLLAGVKVGIALLLARVAWRFVRARAAARASRRLLSALGGRAEAGAPRVKLELSPRLWALAFATTSLLYLVQTDAEQLSAGRWPLLAPWLHSSALPVFAVLAVVTAVVWRAVQRWLADYEQYVVRVAEQARRLVRPPATILGRAPERAQTPPRGLFGLAFESRPPPLPA
jgi:hypothetical protein